MNTDLASLRATIARLDSYHRNGPNGLDKLLGPAQYRLVRWRNPRGNFESWTLRGNYRWVTVELGSIDDAFSFADALNAALEPFVTASLRAESEAESYTADTISISGWRPLTDEEKAALTEPVQAVEEAMRTERTERQRQQDRATLADIRRRNPELR
jgi:hypothetical protein